jgi:hypothetical protein
MCVSLPIGWLLSKKKKGQEITSVGKDVKNLEPLCSFGGVVKWHSSPAKQLQFFKK